MKDRKLISVHTSWTESVNRGLSKRTDQESGESLNWKHNDVKAGQSYWAKKSHHKSEMIKQTLCHCDPHQCVSANLWSTLEFGTRATLYRQSINQNLFISSLITYSDVPVPKQVMLCEINCVRIGCGTLICRYQLKIKDWPNGCGQLIWQLNLHLRRSLFTMVWCGQPKQNDRTQKMGVKIIQIMEHVKHFFCMFHKNRQLTYVKLIEATRVRQVFFFVCVCVCVMYNKLWNQLAILAIFTFIRNNIFLVPFLHS